MEETRKYDDGCISLKMKLPTNLISLESCENSISTTNDIIKLTSKISFRKQEKKQKITKKNIKPMNIDIKFNLGNQSCGFHFTERQNETQNISCHLQENIVNTQIKVTNGSINKEHNSDTSIQFSSIETASSIGSENNRIRAGTLFGFEDDSDNVFLFSNSSRDLDNPYRSYREYSLLTMKQRLINTFAISAFHIIKQHCDSKKIIPYCFFCMRPFQIKPKSSIIKNLMRHTEYCSKFSDANMRDLIKDAKESLKIKKRYSIAELALEYITVPHNEIENRYKETFHIPSRKDERYLPLFQTYTCILCYEATAKIRSNNGDYKSLHQHIISEEHQRLKDQLTAVEQVQEIMNEMRAIFRRKEVNVYLCTLCNSQYLIETDFLEHLYNTDHATRLEAVPDEDKRKRFNYYYCHACLLLWFGHKTTYEQHNNQDEHKARMPHYPYIEYIPKDCLDLLTYVKQNKQLLVTESDLTLKDTGIIQDLLHSLKTDLHSVFPNMRTYLFGSRIAKLALPNSDLDVFLDSDYYSTNTFRGRITHANSQELIKLIESQLSLNDTWKVQKVVLPCKVPVIKILHIPTNLSCDITVTDGLGVRKTKMIKCFIEAFPICRELILFLKRFLQITNQLGSRFITSYAIAWCVIYYLQHLKIFPSVSHLIKLKNKSWLINGWETGVSYDIPVQQTNCTFEELLFGFFRYYSEFNYSQYIICPLLGHEIEKSTFWGRVTVQEFTPYIKYIKRPTNCYTGGKPKRFPLTALTVQDPFDLSHNITKAMNARKLKIFQRICKYASRFLKLTLTGISSKTIKNLHVKWHVNEDKEDEEYEEDEEYKKDEEAEENEENEEAEKDEEYEDLN